MNDMVFPGIWSSTAAEMVNNPSRLERSECLGRTSKVARILPRGTVFPKVVAQVCSDREDVTDMNCANVPDLGSTSLPDMGAPKMSCRIKRISVYRDDPDY